MAMTKLIKDNQGLIWSIVKRFVGRNHETDDLYQIGCMGFIKAIKRFDTSFEVQVSTYAVPYILGEIKKFIRDDGMIKISRSVKELGIYQDESSDDNDKRELITKIPVDTNQELKIINNMALNQVINNLNAREKQIIILRFYKDKTQTEVGRLLGISQVQVSRMEKSVLEKMKQRLEA